MKISIDTSDEFWGFLLFDYKRYISIFYKKEYQESRDKKVY